jgi:hypothetical protein
MRTENRNMKRLLLSLALVAFAFAALGDELVMNSVVKDGSFQGFDKNKFRFLTTKGKFANEQASRVTKLVLKSPRKAMYLTSSSKKEETALLKGFDKQKFTFVKDGKDVVIALSKMTKVEIVPESEGKGGKGNGSGEGYPIPAVDMKSFTGDFTPEQQSALDKFKAAKSAFDDFMKESAAIVSEMDAATGAKREGFLNQLRKRKLDEQPLRKDLKAAYNALVDAFPEKPDEPSKAAQPANDGKTEVEPPAQSPESTQPEEPAGGEQVN